MNLWMLLRKYGRHMTKHETRMMLQKSYVQNACMKPPVEAWGPFYAAVTPGRVALTCVQRVVKFSHTSSHARYDSLRFTNVAHTFGERFDTPWLVLIRQAAKKVWTCTKLFCRPTCEPCMSGHVVTRLKYVRRALVTRLTSFSAFLTRCSRGRYSNASESNHIHYKVWNQITSPLPNWSL